MSVEIEIGANLPEDERLVLTDDDIINHNPIKTHTGKGDFTARVKGDWDLIPYAQRQDRINIKYSSGTEFTGYLIDASPDTPAQIKGDGIAKRLEETRPDYESIGGPVTYSSIALEDALRDYWSRTEFTNFSVTNQSTELVAENDQIQDADTTTEWNNLVSISDDQPLEVLNGELKTLPIAWTTEGEDADDQNSGDSTATPSDNPNYSGGESAVLAAEGGIGSGAADFARWDFTVEHRIPAADFGIQVRDDDNGNVDGVPAFTWYLDHANGNTYTLDSISSVGAGIILSWSDIGTGTYDGNGYQGPDIDPGDYSLRVVVDDSGGDIDTYQYNIDVVAPYDSRYNVTFDNDNGGSSGYLDGPELFPDAETIALSSVTTSYNITAASITSTWNDTSNNQQLEVSNDGGSSFESAANTDTLNATFSSAGRTAVTRLTLSRFGSRTTATPQTGFNGQAVDVYSLEVDGNDLVVIDELELSRNHFDNLQTLCDYGDFLYVIEHDSSSIGNLVVSCFQRGDEQRPAPDGFDNPIDKQPEIQAGTYYNSIYLEGALRADGTRPTAEVSDSDAISNDGREISPGVLRDQKITTDSGAVFRARALLETALSNNDLVGSITVPPTITDPGYARPVDLGDGEEYKTVEEVSLTLGTNSAEATFDFTVREGFSEDISSLKRTARDVGDQV